jgi:excisionase family DNA binding protein
MSVSERKPTKLQTIPAADPIAPIQPRLLRVSEAASYLGTTAGQIRKLVQVGRIEPKRLGARFLFDRKQLDEFVESL